MEISVEDNKKVLKLLELSTSDPDYELECIVGNMNNDFVNKEEFVNILKRFKGKKKYSRMTSNSTLSIYLSNDKSFSNFNSKISRVVLSGNGLINMYNSTNKLNNIVNNVVFERKYFDANKSRREANKLANNDYNIRFNLKMEEQIDNNSDVVSDLLREWSRIPKYFRRKHTFTFYHEDDDFKIDISIISQNKPNQYVQTLKESGVLNNQNVSYEAEVEYIGNKKPNIQSKFNVDSSISAKDNQKEKLKEEVELYKNSVLDTYLEIITSVLQARQQSLYLMTNSERSKVMEKMTNLIKNRGDNYFPLVVDLTRSNCIKLPLNNYNNKDYPPNIRMDYAVTDKADGFRKLLFINNTGKCYLKSREGKTDDKYAFRYTGTIIKEYAYSIFDGELIEQTLDGKYTQNFYIFDAYAVKGASMIDKPFGESKNPEGRYFHIIEFEKYFNKSMNILQDENIPLLMRFKIFKKVYYFGDNHSKLLKVIEKINLKKMDSRSSKYDSKIFEQANVVLSKTNSKYGGELEDGHMFSYGLDGLIFQPVNLGVSQNHLDEKVSKIGRTWFSAFRWKPQHELTIDFMVKFNKDPSNLNQHQEWFHQGNKYIRGTLFVKMWKQNTIHKNLMAFKLLNEGLNFRTLNDDYPFSPIYPFNGVRNSQNNIYDFTSQIYLLVNDKGQIRAHNGDIISDGTTVECAYDFNKKDNMNWTPRKVRQGKVPNSYMTAASAWKLINNPVTTEMIMGKEEVVDDESYYNNQSSEETKAMRSFNNYVKDEIIKRGLSEPITMKSTKQIKKGKTAKTSKTAKTAKTAKPAKDDLFSDLDIIDDDEDNSKYSNPNLERRVLDLACGRFGDYFKYCRNKATYVVGVDISPDNIYNQQQGAAVRLMESVQQSPTCRSLVNNTMLIYGDCTKNISSGEAGLDQLNKYYLDVIYGRTQPNASSSKLSRMYNIGANGFNMVVCNLAIHYMFNDSTTLSNFFTNVSENLTNNGYFIGTFLDGDEILKKLKGNSKIEGYYENKDPTSSKLIWRIETAQKRPLFKDSYLGQKIKVYMDTFMDSYEENLMSLSFMEEEAKQYNLALVDSKLFIDEQDNLFNQFKEEKSQYYKEINKHDSIKEWISFHRWFIFKKVN